MPDMFGSLFRRPNHEDLISQGAKCFNAKEFEKALAIFEEAIKLSPESSDGWRNRAAALSELGDFQRSLDSFNAALNFRPDCPLACLGKAWLLRDYDLLEDARQTFLSIKQSPVELAPYFQAGLMALNSEMVDRSQAELAVNQPRTTFSDGAFSFWCPIPPQVTSGDNPAPPIRCFESHLATQGDLTYRIERVQFHEPLVPARPGKMMRDRLRKELLGMVLVLGEKQKPTVQEDSFRLNGRQGVEWTVKGQHLRAQLQITGEKDEIFFLISCVAGSSTTPADFARFHSSPRFHRPYRPLY